jgi:hypothetical protein
VEKIEAQIKEEELKENGENGKKKTK